MIGDPSKLGFLVLGLAFGTTPAFSQPQPACYIPPDRSISHCLRIQVSRLELSGESAYAVATAAISACDQAERDLDRGLVNCGTPSVLIPQINAAAEQKARKMAVSMVVEIRARRRTH